MGERSYFSAGMVNRLAELAKQKNGGAPPPARILALQDGGRRCAFEEATFDGDMDGPSRGCECSQVKALIGVSDQKGEHG